MIKSSLTRLAIVAALMIPGASMAEEADTLQLNDPVLEEFESETQSSAPFFSKKGYDHYQAKSESSDSSALWLSKKGYDHYTAKSESTYLSKKGYDHYSAKSDSGTTHLR